MNMYLKFWGVATPVFSPGHGRTDLYLSSRLRMSAGRLAAFCGQEQAVTVLLGESGTGKTALTRWFHDTLATDSHEFLLTTLLKEESSPGWLTPRIADYMGIPSSAGRSLQSLVRAVAGRMDELLSENKRLVIAVDAAHLIRDAAWQDIAGFLNMGALAGSCFSFLLVGREELGKHCQAQEDLRNKISCKMEWPRFTAEETAGYIAFRCEQAPLKNPFDDQAVDYIHHLTGGVASAINAMAENALIEAHERKSRLVTAEIARAAGHFIAGAQGEPTLVTPTSAMTESTSSRLLELTKNWIPPPPEAAKPLSPSTGSDATIRMSSLFKSRDHGGDN